MKTLTILFVIFTLSFLTVSCEDANTGAERTEENMENAVDDAGNTIENGVENTGDAMNNAGEDIKEGVEEMGDDIEDATDGH